MFSDDDVKDQIEFDNCDVTRDDEDGDVGTEEELIDLVKACPILYDVRLKVYKDRNMKDRAWRSVADAMKLTGKWNPILRFSPALEFVCFICFGYSENDVFRLFASCNIIRPGGIPNA